MSRIYERPEIYDLAFSYRNYQSEVEFLRFAYNETMGGNDWPTSSLEIACGSGRHSRAFANNGVTFIGMLDSSAEMITASRIWSDSIKGIEIINADMRDFETKRKYDLAFCMLDSISHILNVSDMRAHFGSIRKALTKNGVYILEVAQPGSQDVLFPTLTEWHINGEDVLLEISWGAGAREIDAALNVEAVPVKLTLTFKDGRPPMIVADEYLSRQWTADELLQVANEVGFSFGRMYSSLDVSSNYSSNEPTGWRMIPVFIKAES